jgi:hypothetical protein
VDDDLWLDEAMEELTLAVPGEFDIPIQPVAVRRRGGWALTNAPKRDPDEEMLLL